MRTFRSEHQVDTHIRAPAKCCPVRRRVRPSSRGRRGVGLLTGPGVNGLYPKSISEEEQLNTGGKEKYTFVFLFFFFYQKRKLVQTLDLFNSQKIHLSLGELGTTFLPV